MSKTASIALVIVLLLGLAAGGYYLYTNKQASTQTVNEQVSTPTDNKNDGLSTAHSSELGITLNHPQDVSVVDTQEGTLTLLKIGPTQQEGTEMYDGFSLTFTDGNYSENTLEDFVVTQKEQAEEDMIIEEVSEIDTVTVANRNGYQFSQVGLGEFTLVYLPREEGRYLLISMLVEDPGNLGFRETVDMILSTLIFE